MKSTNTVILTPLQLSVTFKNKLHILYATLWDIESSNIDTHTDFCNLAERMGVFNFGNTGKFADEGIPYTFNDGRYTVSWLAKVCNLITECKKHNIQVIVKLDKKANKSTGVTFEPDTARKFNTDSTNRLIDTYFSVINAVFNQYNTANCISAKFKKLNPYRFNLYDNYISININDTSINK